MKRLILYICCVYICCMSSAALAQGQNLYLVLYSATQDYSIGEGCKINYERVDRQVKKMAQATGMKYIRYCKTGPLVTPQAMKRKLMSLKAQANDVIIFHYSGHAINDGSSQWPRLLLNGGTLKLTTIQKILKSKKARLTLTIGDCCNATYLAQRPRATKNTPRLGSKSNHVTLAYRKLLLQSQGHWLLSGSKRGYSAYYNGLVGGFFTFSLLESIYQNTQYPTSSVSWKNILKGTIDYTQRLAGEMGKRQVPQFEKSMATTRVSIAQLSRVNTTVTLPDIDKVINSGQEEIYITKPGDSFYRIAALFKKKGYSITPHDIASHNHIPINGLLGQGRELKIINQSAKSFQYIVQPGDSLSKIAQDHQISIEALRAWNLASLTGDHLNAGQILTIRKK